MHDRLLTDDGPPRSDDWLLTNDHGLPGGDDWLLADDGLLGRDDGLVVGDDGGAARVGDGGVVVVVRGLGCGGADAFTSALGGGGDHRVVHGAQAVLAVCSR